MQSIIASIADDDPSLLGVCTRFGDILNSAIWCTAPFPAKPPATDPFWQTATWFDCADIIVAAYTRACAFYPLEIPKRARDILIPMATLILSSDTDINYVRWFSCTILATVSYDAIAASPHLSFVLLILAMISPHQFFIAVADLFPPPNASDLKQTVARCLLSAIYGSDAPPGFHQKWFNANRRLPELIATLLDPNIADLPLIKKSHRPMTLMHPTILK